MRTPPLPGTSGRLEARHRPRRRLAGGVVASAIAAAIASPALAAEPQRVSSLADLSLEQLRDVVVSTVSRVEERLDRVPASVYVISADDIRRSGAATIPEALRLAPTLDVARADANQYAVSARGFNNVLANKMLVLIDGRTVYTPLFSGVFWEAQDVMLEDVDRIEVVTGPSTALWGSNAVNGLIHVITKSAAATGGALATLRYGDRESGLAVRYGGAVGDAAHFRIYAKSYDRRDTHRVDGSSLEDAAYGLQTGFRADWSRGPDALTLQGDAYRGNADQPGGARRFSGANVQARWQRGFEGGEASAQVVADHTERVHPGSFGERLDTIDAVAQVTWKLGERQTVIVGGGLRRASDRVDNSPSLAFLPADTHLTWSRVFAQDQIEVRKDLTLSLSASVEGNPYTGTEWLPGVRLGWTPSEGHLAWASYARAVRAPSRIDRDFFAPGSPPFVLAGGPDFVSEVSDVYELGYRGQASAALSYSLTLFEARHRRLRSLAPTAAGLQFENGIGGFSRGVESWARWRVSEAWHLDAGLVLQNERLAVTAGATDAGGLAALGNDPHRLVTLRSSAEIRSGWSWEVAARHVGPRPLPVVPAYTAVDSRVVWRATTAVELSLGVQNLLDRRHAEWGPPANRAEIERSVFALLRLRN
jgi:iron complex outermembrane receptor protein